ncbi:MAG TPA: hypothetical protein VKR22_04110 [Acidimicrobiales bacterium]|nr:hypothetical protein [Acidimicrobiales bacterium]
MTIPPIEELPLADRADALPRALPADTESSSAPTVTSEPARDDEVKRQSRPIGPVAICLGIYALFAVFGFWHAWSAGAASHAISPDGDQALSMWFLSWTSYSLVHLHNPFFSNFGNYPAGVNALVNTTPLPLYVLLSPVTLIWGPVASYNLFGTLAFFLSATAAFFLVRRFVRWTPAAFLGGLVYGFSPYVVAQGTGHANLEFVALPPLIMLCVLDIVTGQARRPVRRGVLLGVLVTLQFLISAEILLSTAVMVVAGLCVLGWIARRDIVRRVQPAIRPMAWAAGVAAVLTAYPLWALLAGPAHIVGPTQAAPQVYRADFLGPVIPSPLVHFAPDRLLRISAPFAGNGSENGSYLGLPLLLVLLVGVIVLRKKRVVVVAAILGAFAFLMSLGSHLLVDNHNTGIPLPEGVFDKIPLFQNTIPVRYALYAALFAGIVLATFVEWLHESAVLDRRRVASALVPMSLGLGSLVPLFPTWPYPMVPVGIPTFFTSGASNSIAPGSVVVFYPFPQGVYAQPQLWQATTFMRFKMPGGRYSVPTPGTGALTVSPPSVTNSELTLEFAGGQVPRDPAIRASIRSEFRRWDVRYLIATPGGADYTAAVGWLTWLTGTTPVTKGGVQLWELGRISAVAASG